MLTESEVPVCSAGHLCLGGSGSGGCDDWIHPERRRLDLHSEGEDWTFQCGVIPPGVNERTLMRHYVIELGPLCLHYHRIE